MPAPEEEEERRKRKAAEKAQNAERIEREELPKLLAQLPETLSFNDLALEHGKLRMRLTEWQTMAIQGKLDFRKVQEWERVVVDHIHRIEERARVLQTGRHVPRPGE